MKSLENINNDVLVNKSSFCLIHSKEINHEIGTSLNKRMTESLNKSSFIVANSNFTKTLVIKLEQIKKIIIINPDDYPISINESSKQAKEIYDNSFQRLLLLLG